MDSEAVTPRADADADAADGRRVPPPAVPQGPQGPENPAQAEQVGAPGAPGVGPKLRAASPGDPFYLPRASWLWLTAAIGLVVAAAPQALLTIAALFGGSSSGGSSAVSAGDAIALAVGSLVLYGWEGFAAWLFSVRSAGRSFVLWGFRRPTKAYFWVVPLGLVAVYAFSIAHDSIVNPKQQAIVNDFPHSVLGAGMFLLVAVVMAPVFEEIVFRGFLFRGFANSWGWVWGALASAAIFGAAHLQLDVFLPLAALGFVLAWAYKKTGSLWTCITMHALFNLIAVVAWIVSS
jgi:membrane protease YdiL (CAAX protease family)